MTIAREIELEDPYENLGAQLAKEVATKTNDVAVTARRPRPSSPRPMVKEGLRNVAAGAAPAALSAAWTRPSPRSTTACSRTPASSTARTRVASVATLSAQDSTLGGSSARRSTWSARTGHHPVEESSTTATELEFNEGMQFDKGYLSAYFVTDTERMETVLEDAYVLINQGKISSEQRSSRSSRRSCSRASRCSSSPRMSTARPSRPRGQQDPWHVQRRGGQGPRLRRTPQGHCPGHRHPHRLARSSRPGRAQPRPGRPDRPRPGRRVVLTKDNTTIIDGNGAEARSRPPVHQIKAEIERTTPTGTRRSSRSASPSSRWRLRHQGRRAHRGRAQGEDAPPSRTRSRDACRDRGGHRRRWSAPPSFTPPRDVDALELTGDGHGRVHRAQGPSPSRCAGSPRTRAPLGLRRHLQGGGASRSARASTRPTGELRRPHRGRRHRPGQGHPLRAAQRRGPSRR